MNLLSNWNHFIVMNPIRKFNSFIKVVSLWHSISVANLITLDFFISFITTCGKSHYSISHNTMTWLQLWNLLVSAIDLAQSCFSSLIFLSILNQGTLSSTFSSFFIDNLLLWNHQNFIKKITRKGSVSIGTAWPSHSSLYDKLLHLHACKSSSEWTTVK